jgi:hypothetical protein
MATLACPKCQAALKTPADKVGGRAGCPKCGSPVRLPGPRLAIHPAWPTSPLASLRTCPRPKATRNARARVDATPGIGNGHPAGAREATRAMGKRSGGQQPLVPAKMPRPDGCSRAPIGGRRRRSMGR